MIEVAQFTIDQETHEERYIRLRVLNTQESIAFNTAPVTGIEEQITVCQTGRIVRESGETLQLVNTTAAPDENMLSVGEVFLTGPTGKVLSIRRINFIVNALDNHTFDNDIYDWTCAGFEYRQE